MKSLNQAVVNVKNVNPGFMKEDLKDIWKTRHSFFQTYYKFLLRTWVELIREQIRILTARLFSLCVCTLQEFHLKGWTPTTSCFFLREPCNFSSFDLVISFFNLQSSTWRIKTFESCDYIIRLRLNVNLSNWLLTLVKYQVRNTLTWMIGQNFPSEIIY